MDAIVIFRPLRPICILVCTRKLFPFIYDLDLCMCSWILDSLESLWLYYIFFCGFLCELVQCYYLIPPASRACYNVHETLGGAFPKRHRADCGVIAPIRKVPILGHHRGYPTRPQFAIAAYVCGSTRCPRWYTLFCENAIRAEEESWILCEPRTEIHMPSYITITVMCIWWPYCDEHISFHGLVKSKSSITWRFCFQCCNNVFSHIH
jgi:hypothetical protein